MDESYFQKIPKWSDTPRFSITADAWSGRIPVTRIESWKEFSSLLEDEFLNQPKIQYAFRGHRRFDWGLLPSLGRVAENGIVTETLAADQLNLFRRAIRGRINDNTLLEVNSDTDDELWAVGQHHGLMTPLLDWTYSPYVALFFAFSKEDEVGEENNPYRAVYLINKSFVDDDGKCPDIRVLEPRRDNHGRLVNQAGLFTFSPTDSTIENKLIEVLSEDETIGKGLIQAVEEHEGFIPSEEENEAQILSKYICKIYIKNEDREGCLRALRKMNVHHASLFPDVLGASEHCNLLIEEKYRQIKIEGEINSNQFTQTTIVTVDETDAPNSDATVELEKNKYSATILSVLHLLRTPTVSQSVEPGRIQLIAEELSRELEKYKLVDWESRDPLHAKIRNVARVMLRKLGYPEAGRDYVVEGIIGALEKTEDSNP